MMTSVTNLLLGLVAFGASPLAARLLGPEGRGRLVAVQLVPQLLADLSALGLGFAVVHFGARYHRTAGTLVRWALAPIVVGSATMMAIGYLVAPSIAAGVPEDQRLMRLYLILCPITALMIVLLESIRSMGDFRQWNTFLLLRGLSWPIALVVGVTRATPSLAVVVWTHLALMSGLVAVLAVVVVRRTRVHRSVPPIDRAQFVRYGLTSAVSTIPRSANAKLDQVVMTVVVGRENLGLYAAAVGWSALTVPVMRGLTSITMPHLSSAVGDERLVRSRHLVTMGLVAVTLLAVAGVAATLLLWGPLYGSEFRGALGAALVLIPAALLLEFNAVLGNVLRSLDRPGMVALLEAGIMMVSTIALLAVLRIDEVMGPALVSLVTYGVACVGYAYYICRQLDIPMRRLIDGEYVRTVGRSLRGRRSN